MFFMHPTVRSPPDIAICYIKNMLYEGIRWKLLFIPMMKMLNHKRSLCAGDYKYTCQGNS
jgi:hypothetical protein